MPRADLVEEAAPSSNPLLPWLVSGSSGSSGLRAQMLPQKLSFPYTTGSSVQVTDFLRSAFQKQRSVPAGANTPWWVLPSLQLRPLSQHRFYSAQLSPYGLTWGPRPLPRHSFKPSIPS